MAATAWALYNKAKGKIGNGTIKLSVDTMRMHLFKGNSTANTATQSIVSQITNEVTTGGYASKQLTADTWTSVAAGTWRFDSTNLVFSAVGSAITSALFAVVRIAGASANANHALMWSQLTTTGTITVNAGNTLTIQIHANGYFELA